MTFSGCKKLVFILSTENQKKIGRERAIKTTLCQAYGTPTAGLWPRRETTTERTRQAEAASSGNLSFQVKKRRHGKNGSAARGSGAGEKICLSEKKPEGMRMTAPF